MLIPRREMISREEYTVEIYNKTGRDLLPENVVEDFLEIRGIDYYNVIKKRLVEYTRAEWVVCLREKIMLEQCVPLFLEELSQDLLIPGVFYKGEILYEVTLIDKDFWLNHKDWFECIKTIIYKVLNMSEQELKNNNIIHEYIESYKKFYHKEL